MEILNLIRDKEEIGISEMEISKQLDMKIRDVRTATRRFYNKRLIFRNLSTNRWRLIKYKNSEIGDPNNDLEWTAG